MATKALASKVGQVKFLQKGEPGAIGPMAYPAGEYAADTSYTRTALSAPMVLCEGDYYVLAKEGTFKGINPKTDYAANGSKATWLLMDKMRYAFIEVLMANFAKLASAVFHGQYMFSQYGVDASGNPTDDYRNFGTADFTPNLLLDFLTGSFKGRNVEVDGGVFRNVRSPNDAFRINEDGDIEILGKFSTSMNGTRIEMDPNTNSIKMYNQDDNEVGDISFLEEDFQGKKIYYPRIRLRRYYNNTILNEAVIGDRTLRLATGVGSDESSCLLDPVYGLTFYQGTAPAKKYPAK